MPLACTTCHCFTSHPDVADTSPLPQALKEVGSSKLPFLSQRSPVPSTHPMNSSSQRCPNLAALSCSTWGARLQPPVLQPAALSLCRLAQPAVSRPTSPALAVPSGPDKLQTPMQVGLASPGTAAQAPGQFPGWPQSPEGSGHEGLPYCFSFLCFSLHCLLSSLTLLYSMFHRHPTHSGLTQRLGSRYNLSISSKFMT